MNVTELSKYQMAVTVNTHINNEDQCHYRAAKHSQNFLKEVNSSNAFRK